MKVTRDCKLQNAKCKLKGTSSICNLHFSISNLQFQANETALPGEGGPFWGKAQEENLPGRGGGGSPRPSKKPAGLRDTDWGKSVRGVARRSWRGDRRFVLGRCGPPTSAARETWCNAGAVRAENRSRFFSPRPKPSWHWRLANSFGPESEH